VTELWSGDSGRTDWYSAEICGRGPTQRGQLTCSCTTRAGATTTERERGRARRRTCSPFSRSTRSHSRTSPATSPKSRARSSSSPLHALTISSSVLPRRSDGVGAGGAVDVPAPRVVPVVGAAGAPRPREGAAGALEAGGLAPNVSADEVAGAAAAGLGAPNESAGAAGAAAGAALEAVVVEVDGAAAGAPNENEGAEAAGAAAERCEERVRTEYEEGRPERTRAHREPRSRWSGRQEAWHRRATAPRA